MKKATLFALAALAVVSTAAYARMQTGDAGQAGSPHAHDSHSSNTSGHGHGSGMMHMGMMHGGMHGGGNSDTHGSSGSHGTMKGDSGPSSLAFHGANTKMHSAMNVAFTGNADVDFVKGMIPHHAGAIDMAKIALAFGKDPEVRKLAEAIIKAQESEIAWMQDWLKNNAK
jgi:uncharacterized protein (DUF305 family)